VTGVQTCALPIYYPRFITPEVVAEGREKLAAHKEVLDAVEKRFGVEREIIVAIWGVETRFGRNDGSFNLFETLNTLFSSYPRRSAFYRDQLIHLLLLCRENGRDPRSVNGSYGGAFGQTQFIPSSFRSYAIDFDGDGARNVWESTPDVLASIANYLHRYGWSFGAPIYRELGKELKGEPLKAAYGKGRKGFVSREEVERLQERTLDPVPEGKNLTIVGLELDEASMRYVAGYPNFQAITAWNNSNRYAMVVTELAEHLGLRR